MAVIRGSVGVIKWSYYNAAAIEGYTVNATKDGRWSLHCRILNSDSFKMRQRPLIFVAPHQHGEWRWPIYHETMSITGDRMQADLGQPLP